MEKLFLLMPDLTGTRIDLDSQSNKKLTDAEIIAPVGIEKADLPGLVDDLAGLVSADATNAAAISSEEAARIAGDAAEAAARAAGEKAITEAFESADADLTAELEAAIEAGDDAEAAARAAGEKAITEAYEAADSALSGKISDEKARIDAILTAATADADSFAEIVTLINSVDTENDNAFAGYVSSNDAALATEVQDRIDGDAAEASARLAGDEKAASDLKAVASDLDAKITEEIEQLSDDVEADISSRVENLTADIKANAIQSADADAALEADIKANAIQSTDADQAIVAAVGYMDRGDASAARYNEYAAETENEFAENGPNEFYPVNGANFQAWLDDKKTQEIEQLSDDVQADISSLDGNLTANIKSESEARAAGDAQAASDLKAVAGDLDAKIAEEIKAEAEARLAGDDQAASDLKAVASDLDAADNAIIAAYEAADKSITATFEAADVALDGKIGDEKARIDAILTAATADADSFAEIVTLINSVDTENDNAFAGYVSSNDAALATEVQDRIDGDAQAASDLKAVAGDLDAKIAEEIKTEAEARLAADTAVIAAFEAADKSITATFEAADASLANAIADENTRAMNAEGVNAAAIAAAEATLDAKIDSEIARAEAAEGELDGKIAEIISNTDVTSLDSFSEVEAGVNAGFEGLRDMMLSVARNSVEANFGAVAADGTQVLFAGYPTERPKVFVNGLLQEEDVDYTVAGTVDGKGLSASDITFAAAPVAGAKVMVLGVESAHAVEDRYEAPVVFEGGAA